MQASRATPPRPRRRRRRGRPAARRRRSRARSRRPCAPVIRSPGTKTCASGSTRSGTTAMVMPAKPEVTCRCAPGEQREGQRVREEPHADAMQPNPPPAPVAVGGSPCAGRERQRGQDHRGDADAAGGDRRTARSRRAPISRRGTTRPRSARAEPGRARRAARGQGGQCGMLDACRAPSMPHRGSGASQPRVRRRDTPWQPGGNRLSGPRARPR